MDLLASLSQFTPMGLIIIMFGMGLSLTVADFKPSPQRHWRVSGAR